MQTNKNDSAFPIFDGSGEHFIKHGGLSKKEYFAAMALQGLILKNRSETQNPIAPLFLQKIHQWSRRENIYGLIALLSLALRGNTSLITQQILFKFDIHPKIISEIEESGYNYQQVIVFLAHTLSLYE